MGAGFLKTFRPRRGLQDLVPRSPEDRGGQEKKFRVIVDDEYLGSITYYSVLIKSL